MFKFSCKNTIKVAVIGVGGYTGIEILRILSNHPQAEVKFLINTKSGTDLGELYPSYDYLNLPKTEILDDVNLAGIDAVFVCVPHGTGREIVEKCFLKYPKLKIFDLSADFRINNAKQYRDTYSVAHYSESLIVPRNVVAYGLTEVYKDKIKNSRVVACPGCYPTSILLPTIPLFAALEGGESDSNRTDILTPIIIDSKSGTTGSGRKQSVGSLFAEKNESVSAYSVANHRHVLEMMQELKLPKKDLIFTPHVVPMSRGILSSIYLRFSENAPPIDSKKILEKYYENSRFVKVVDRPPSTREVAGTNMCKIFVYQEGTNVVIVSVIDNLCKGSSGQAVQNMNISFNLSENLGLNLSPVFP